MEIISQSTLFNETYRDILLSSAVDDVFPLAQVRDTFLQDIIISNESKSLEDDVRIANRDELVRHQLSALENLRRALPSDSVYLNEINAVYDELQEQNKRKVGSFISSLNGVKMLGMYNPGTKTIYIYLDAICAVDPVEKERLFRVVYLHELMHAYFDREAGQNGGHYIYEIEETMAELGMLLCCDAQDLDYARHHVASKKIDDLAPYGFASYCENTIPYDDVKELVCHYATVAGNICKDSFDVIRYIVEINRGYPQQDGENVLCMMLTNSILQFRHKQDLKFEALYSACKEQLNKVIWDNWNSKPGKDVDPCYAIQLKKIIESTMNDNIMVESMAQWQSTTPLYKNGGDYNKASGNLWKKNFLPFKHQMEAWTKLLAQGAYKHSMVITTGTGSGKTESFMIPLIADLKNYIAQNGQDAGVQAIFLYPLNALMEDQKERLNAIIEASGADITFAAYNGNSPSLNNNDPVRRQQQFKDSWATNSGGELINRFSHELVFRQEIRGEVQWDPINQQEIAGRVPNIILTNPTMLEYILLRQVDRPLIKGKSLKWFVIDETHSYSGAGADELAMQIRRVLMAYDVTPNDVHFATSSATVGSDISKLRDFISGITGQQQIDVIEGKRSLPSYTLAGQDYSVISKLASNNYVYLKDLIPLKASTEDRLRELDRLAECGLRVKVHFFDKALTNGLFVNLEKLNNGYFELEEEIPLDRDYRLSPHYLVACHCKQCGAVLANGHITTDKYSREKDDYYIVPEVPYSTSIRSNTNNVQAFSLSPNNIANNTTVIKNGVNTNIHARASLGTCPCCGASEESIRRFSISALATNQGLLPSLMDQTTMRSVDMDKPYKGHQLISFADSRRGAARPSMQQNLDTEEIWVISTIRDAIVNKCSLSVQKLIRYITEANNVGDYNAASELQNVLIRLRNGDDAQAAVLAANCSWLNNLPPYITWSEALIALTDSPYSRYLAACFAKEKDIIGSLDDNEDFGDNLDTTYIYRYVLSALYRVMHKRNKSTFSAEGNGLLKVVYPLLDKVSALPQSVVSLNGVLPLANQIDLSEWKNLLQVYLDYDVRVNECLFYRDRSNTQHWKNIDISSCRDLSSTYTVRRSVKDFARHHSTWNIYGMLMKLFGCDSKTTLDAINPSYYPLLEAVVKDMGNELIDPSSNFYSPNTLTSNYLLTYGETYDGSSWTSDILSPADANDRRTGYRLNLDNLAFVINDDVYEDAVAETLHNVTFKEMSPYDDHQPCARIKLTSSIPSFIECDKRTKALNGTDSLFIQVEHTAQVNKKRTQERIDQFKKHNINVLACSTTMEMGVDIGELEVVAMANVPPHPANYKQRVGRAGRAMQNKSVSVTTCNSDAVGLPVLDNPKVQLLEREVQTPVTRLHSPQIVQRHINSYLLREFFASATGLNTGQIRTWSLMKFFFTGNAVIEPVGPIGRRLKVGNIVCYPNDYYAVPTPPNNIDFHINSPYTQFIGWLTSRKNLNDYDAKILQLCANTCFDNAVNNSAPTVDQIIDSTIQSINRLFTSWQDSLVRFCNGVRAENLNWNSFQRKSKQVRLNFEFMNWLTPTIESYFGEQQLIPNANMPVGVVAAKINYDDSFDNPSRSLPVALSEYAPGQQRVMDGKTYRMSGVEWDNSVAYTELLICGNCGHIIRKVLGHTPITCPMCHNNNLVTRDLIVPTAFLTESSTSRSMDEGGQVKVYTGILDAPSWPSPTNPNGLTQVLLDDPTHPASIITYIAGNGPRKGYCICIQKDNNDRICGRSVAEIDDNSTPASNISYYQKLIGSKHRHLHNGQTDYFILSEIKPHTLIGGEFKTDFSLLYAKTSPTANNSVSDEILTTLGILACDELSLSLPCERQDIAFFIAGDDNGRKSLCIYDIAKGGAGYSSQLNEILWSQILDRCRDKLKIFIQLPKPELNLILSRSTMRYMDEIDIKGTYEWLVNEYKNRILSTKVQSVFPGAIIVNRGTMDTALSRNGVTKMIFVAPDIKKWNYDLTGISTPSWQSVNNYYTPGGKLPLVFTQDPGLIPPQLVPTFQKITSWADLKLDHGSYGGLYPLAFVDKTLYVTDDVQYAQLNGNWAQGLIFAVPLNQAPSITAYSPILPTNSIVWIPQMKTAFSDGLYNLVDSLDSTQTMSKFLNNARGHRLHFKYTDEHVKNQLSMYIVIQFIRSMAAAANCCQYDVEMVNEQYSSYQGKTANDSSRNLRDGLLDNYERDAVLANLMNSEGINFSIKSLKFGQAPHWRCLAVTDLDTNQTLNVMPHGGFANDWNLDTNRATQYYGVNNTNSSTSIPICSVDHTILYVISLQ